jgi:hypothetical protein
MFLGTFYFKSWGLRKDKKMILEGSFSVVSKQVNVHFTARFLDLQDLRNYAPLIFHFVAKLTKVLANMLTNVGQICQNWPGVGDKMYIVLYFESLIFSFSQYPHVTACFCVSQPRREILLWSLKRSFTMASSLSHASLAVFRATFFAYRSSGGIFCSEESSASPWLLRFRIRVREYFCETLFVLTFLFAFPASSLLHSLFSR